MHALHVSADFRHMQLYEHAVLAVQSMQTISAPAWWRMLLQQGPHCWHSNPAASHTPACSSWGQFTVAACRLLAFTAGIQAALCRSAATMLDTLHACSRVLCIDARAMLSQLCIE